MKLEPSIPELLLTVFFNVFLPNFLIKMLCNPWDQRDPQLAIDAIEMLWERLRNNPPVKFY